MTLKSYSLKSWISRYLFRHSVDMFTWQLVALARLCYRCFCDGCFGSRHWLALFDWKLPPQNFQLDIRTQLCTKLLCLSCCVL